MIDWTNGGFNFCKEMGKICQLAVQIWVDHSRHFYNGYNIKFFWRYNGIKIKSKRIKTASQREDQSRALYVKKHETFTCLSKEKIVLKPRLHGGFI